MEGCEHKMQQAFLSEGWLQGTSVLGCFYGRMVDFGDWGSGKVIVFAGGPLKILEVRDRKKVELSEETSV